MGRQKSIKQTANQEAWAELDAVDGGNGPRLVIPRNLFWHENYRRMSYSARALLWEVASDYSGGNNGYLSAEWRKMKELGWGSDNTVREALAELVHYGWLVQTQIGGRDHKPNLYGITWRKLNRRANQPLALIADSEFDHPLGTYKQPREPYQKPKGKTPQQILSAVKDAA